MRSGASFFAVERAIQAALLQEGARILFLIGEESRLGGAMTRARFLLASLNIGFVAGDRALTITANRSSLRFACARKEDNDG